MVWRQEGICGLEATPEAVPGNNCQKILTIFLREV